MLRDEYIEMTRSVVDRLLIECKVERGAYDAKLQTKVGGGKSTTRLLIV